MIYQTFINKLRDMTPSKSHRKVTNYIKLAVELIRIFGNFSTEVLFSGMRNSEYRKEGI